MSLLASMSGAGVTGDCKTAAAHTCDEERYAHIIAVVQFAVYHSWTVAIQQLYTICIRHAFTTTTLC